MSDEPAYPTSVESGKLMECMACTSWNTFFLKQINYGMLWVQRYLKCKTCKRVTVIEYHDPVKVTFYVDTSQEEPHDPPSED